MKKMDIFCTSQASAAICLSMEQKQPSRSSSPSSSSSSLLLGRALDRYNPIIRDSRRIAKSLPPCTISQPPVSPKPLKNQIKKKSTKDHLKENDDKDKNLNSLATERTDQKAASDDNGSRNSKAAVIARKSWSCTRPSGFVSPPGSTRYLLSDKAASNADLGPGLELFPAEIPKSEALKTEEPSSSPKQVVVLRVSLHCRGCEKKMRKHISRMEGVTSFNIDFAAKKVTIVGDVTPSGVLSSISKVKNAQLWPPNVPSSVQNFNLSESVFKKEP